MTIWLDAGHGGIDSGAINKKEGIAEKDLTLKIALKVRELLEKKGVKVILTREKDEKKTYEERLKPQRENSCDLCLSIHLNGFKKSEAEGFEAWVFSKATREEENLGKLLLKEIEKISPYKNRGLKKGYPGLPDKDFWVNRLTKAPSCLLELGFVTGKTEGRFILENFESYARAISNGVLEFLGKEEKGKSFDFVVTNLNEKNLRFLLDRELLGGEKLIDFLKRQQYRFKISERK